MRSIYSTGFIQTIFCFLRKSPIFGCILGSILEPLATLGAHVGYLWSHKLEKGPSKKRFPKKALRGAKRGTLGGGGPPFKIAQFPDFSDQLAFHFVPRGHGGGSIKSSYF